MKTLKQACTPRASIFDTARRDTVLDLVDLAEDRIDADEFFAENYITEGMRVLLAEGFRRLEGSSDQGVFKLTQAMGGGKTHNLLAFGLLARHPELREPVMGGFHRPAANLGRVRVVAFSGRESDAPYGVWGAIAAQLGRRDQFKDYYAPLSAPGQTAWVNLLKGEPLLILLDELPPYFENARSKPIGNSDLSAVTGTALANLFVALGKPGLQNVCLVITDLTASYQAGAQRIHQALADLERETGRLAMNLEPVRMNTDEFYHILRTRIFEKGPAREDIDEIAQAYARAVRDARQMDVTNASPEQFARSIAEAYPFHPAIRDLYARFKENPGFQQTRGLIRLMRIVASGLWRDYSDTRYLISAHDIDLNDREVSSEINQVNPTLESAIAHDIASNGQAVAEVMDTNQATRDAGDVARLLLVSSLANIPGATKGLAIPEIVANLCAPGRDISRLKNDVIGRFMTAAWYLHPTAEGRLYFKNVQNLVARLKTTAVGYLREQAVMELKARLEAMFKPDTGWCYQTVYALPAVDEIDIVQDRVSLVIFEPHPNGLHPDLKGFYDQLTFQNRVLFLTGQRNFDALINPAKELRAIHQIIAELVAEGTPDQDPQLVQARDLQDRITAQFLSTVRETFTTLYYPAGERLANADFLMEFTANRYRGEEQIVKTLAGKQKYTEDVSSDTFRQKAEQRLFTQKVMLWSEIKRRSATSTAWQWHRPDALEHLKGDCVHRDRWRQDGGYLDKGPFPLPDTSIKVQELSRDEDTGSVKLRITPVNGDTVYVEIGGTATPASQRLSGRDYETSELVVSFLAEDSTNGHATGTAYTWKNRITLKHRVYQAGTDKMLELSAAPEAPMRYSTDGSNPMIAGATYESPFVIPAGTRLVLACAERNGVQSETHKFEIDWTHDPAEEPIDQGKPARWRPKPGFSFTTTRTAYGFVARMKKFESQAGNLSVRVLGQQWVDLNMEESVSLGGERLEQVVEFLRGLVPEGEVSVEAGYLQFPSGQHLLDYVEDIHAEVHREDVEQ